MSPRVISSQTADICPARNPKYMSCMSLAPSCALSVLEMPTGSWVNLRVNLKTLTQITPVRSNAQHAAPSLQACFGATIRTPSSVLKESAECKQRIFCRWHLDRARRNGNTQQAQQLLHDLQDTGNGEQ